MGMKAGRSEGRAYMCRVEWTGLGEIERSWCHLEDAERPWSLEAFPICRSCLRTTGENCPFVGYFKNYFLAFQMPI